MTCPLAPTGAWASRDARPGLGGSGGSSELPPGVANDIAAAIKGALDGAPGSRPGRTWTRR